MAWAQRRVGGGQGFSFSVVLKCILEDGSLSRRVLPCPLLLLADLPFTYAGTLPHNCLKPAFMPPVAVCWGIPQRCIVIRHRQRKLPKFFTRLKRMRKQKIAPENGKFLCFRCFFWRGFVSTNNNCCCISNFHLVEPSPSLLKQFRGPCLPQASLRPPIPRNVPATVAERCSSRIGRADIPPP